jgi:HEAT repeat protein
LSEFAIEYTGNIAEIALSRIDSWDQNLLREIIRNAKSPFVRYQAYCKLGLENSQEALTDYAINGDLKFKEVRFNAIAKLSDQNVLIEIAKNDKNYIIRRYAYQNLFKRFRIEYTSEALVDFYNNDEDKNVRINAIKKLKDEKILSEIAKTSDSSEIIYIVIEKLNNANALELISDIIISLINKILLEKNTSTIEILKYIYNNVKISDEIKKQILQINGQLIRKAYHQDQGSKCSEFIHLHSDNLFPDLYFNL